MNEQLLSSAVECIKHIVLNEIQLLETSTKQYYSLIV